MKNKKLLLIIAFSLLVIFLAWRFFLSTGNQTTPPKTDTTSGEATINTEPSTEEETNQSEQKKADIVERQNQESSNQNNANSKKSVTPVITSSDKNMVFAYVNGVVEDGGTCTFTFSGNGVVSKKSSGVADASKTNCSAKTPSLAGNGWSVVLQYNSPSASGKSQPRKVDQ